MSKRTLACVLFSALCVYSLIATGLVYGQATSFTLEGIVKEATGAAVGQGFTVEATNQRVLTGWLADPVAKTRDDGSYTIVYLDPFGGRTTNVNDEIRFTVTDGTGKRVGGKTYTVTQAAVDARRDTVDVLLSGILVDPVPGAIPADGTSTSAIKVTVQDENGDLVTNDTLTITPETGKGTVGEVTNNGDGTYSATYTAPSLLLTASTTDTLTVASTVLGEQVSSAITLQVVPTIVTVAIDPNAFSADSTETGTVVVTVNRGVPVTDETIQLELTRSDGSDDKGSVSNVTNNADGTYSATYTPAKTSGRVTLTATATNAGVSAEGIITINAGPPANIALTATPTTVSSQATSRLTAKVTDAAGNGVGGQTLNSSTTGTGTIGAFSETATFGEYATTYTAPLVDAEGTEDITVTVANSSVSGDLTLQLTPIPPKEVQILVVTGTVFKKNSTIPVVGTNVTVTVNAKPTQALVTDANGAYTATFFEPVDVAARTGDLVSIVVTDDQGNERGRVPEFALTNDDLGEEDNATVKRDVPTDIQSTTSVLAVTGTIFLEDGQTPADGLTLTIANSSRGLQTTAVANENSAYEGTFFDPLQVVAETNDELTFTVTDTDGSTFEMTHTLTGDEVEANRVTVNVTTNFLARERQVFNVGGTVFFEDGQTRAQGGLQILVKINNSEQQTTTEADGTYNVAFVDVLGANVIAQTGDVVDVEVTAVDTNRVVGTVMHTVSTAEVTARLATINVTTDLIGAPTNLLVVEGLISNPDGTPAEAGLNVTVTANANPPQSTTTEANGSYTVTFFNPLETVAAPRDTVEVQVTRAATGDTAVQKIQLATNQVNDQKVTIDVRFPSVVLDVAPVAAVSLDGNGDGGADILVTVTTTAGEPVTNVTVSASLAGVGNVASTATNNGDGTYTVGYTVSKAVGTATIEITTSAVASPTETVQVTVVDEINPIAIALAGPTIVQLNEPVTFDGTQSTDNVEIASFSWDFDADGITDATDAGPLTFTYTSGGVFAATLTVTDTSGNQATDTVEVSVGGLAVRGRILEADDRILGTDSAVIVGVTHVRTGSSASAMPNGSSYTVAFDKPQTDAMTAGDNLLIQAVSSANPAVLLGSETYTLTDADLNINLANVPDVGTDRTSSYTIRGRIRDGSGQAIQSAIVSARGISTSTDSSGSYALEFRNYLTNPVRGEDILIRAEVPGGVPRRGMVIAFSPETPSRSVRVDLNAIAIGGLAINTRHYRNFLDKLVGLAIAQTGVGQLLGGAGLLRIIRSNPELQGSLTSLLQSLIPGGIIPLNLLIKPELPLLFGQPENIDLENFGNGIFPDPFGNIIPALDTQFGNLTPVIVGDKLDLYLVAPNADRVTFSISGPQLQTVDAQQVINQLMHTFQLEEEQAILLLPSWPGLNEGMREVFSNVTLVYAATDTPTTGPEVNPLQTLLQDVGDVALDLQTKLDEIGLEVDQLQTDSAAILVDSNLTITQRLDKTINAVENARAQVELTPEQNAALDEALADLQGLLAGNTQFLQAARQLAAQSGLTLQKVLENIPSIPSLTDLQSKTPAELAQLQSEAETFLTSLETVLKEMRDTLTPKQTTVDKLVSDLEAVIVRLKDNITGLNATIDILVGLNMPDAIVNIFRNQKTATETGLSNVEAQLTKAQTTQTKITTALSSIDTVLGLITEVRQIDFAGATDLTTQIALLNQLTDIVNQGTATLKGLTETLAALNRAIVLPPEAYQRAALQPREIGQKVVWETTLDLQPGKTYYYYYEVALKNPIAASLPGFPPDYVLSQYAIPDPRNLQIEDRGLVERIFTTEFQTIIAEILDPVVNALAGGQPIPAVDITPERQQALLDSILPEVTAISEEISATLDPMLASLFTVPSVSSVQSLWVGKFDFNGTPNGDYQLEASVFADGTLQDQVSGKSFSIDRSAPEADTVIDISQNAGMYRRADGTLVATALPSDPGSTSTLSVTANPVPASDQSDLTAYLYQMIPLSENPDEQLAQTWLPLLVGSSTGYGLGLVDQLNQLEGILGAGSIQLVTDLLDVFPATVSPPHRTELLLRGPFPPELSQLIALLPGALPVTVQNNTVTLNPGEYGLRTVGVDGFFNLGSNTVPVRLNIVPPDADRAKVTFVVLADCNLDGDTDDPFESGATDQELTIFSDTLNPVLTIEIIERTAHPLTSIVVEFKAVGENAEWQEITTLSGDQLSGAQAGSTFQVDWNIENFDDLLAAGDRVEVRAVATNALSIADAAPSRATLLLDEGLCPLRPQIISVEAVADDLNPDSGAPRGNITMNALTPRRVGRTKAIQFQIRRAQDADDAPWQVIGEATDSEPIETETTPDIIGGLVGIVVGGEPSVNINQPYSRWSLIFDSTTIDDTITVDSPAARDASLDDNPYVLRAVAIDFDDSIVEPSALVKDKFSLDNIDDVAPLTGTQIVDITDEAGVGFDPVDGIFTVGELIGEGFTTPLITLTAEPAADPPTFDTIQLFVNLRNPDGTAGDIVDIGEIFFSDAAPYTAVLELDLDLFPNGEYLFQALTTDESGNQEERDVSFASAVDVANVEFLVEVNVDDIIEQFPGGFPVANEFVFTLTAEGIEADEIDVLINGESARGSGLLTVSSEAAAAPVANRQIALQEPGTLTVTTDTSTLADGVYTLGGKISKPNGEATFALPKLNVDHTPPATTILSPPANDQVGPLPTIHATYVDGTGGGVEASDVELELIRLLPGESPDEVLVDIDQSAIHKDATTLVYTRGEILPGGAYRVTLSVTDIVGNIGGAESEFTIVGTLPSVSILSPLLGQILDNSQPDIIAVFTGAGNVEVTTFTLDDNGIDVTADMLDGNRLTHTPDPPLVEGRHTVVVEITDGDGNTARASVTFTVSTEDATPPVITQVSPLGVVKSADITLSVVASDEQSGIASITLSLDGDTAEDGASRDVTGLSAGNHTVETVVTNGASLETLFSWSFTVELDQPDTTPPVISVVAPQGVIKEENTTLSAVVSDDQSAITRVTIALDGGTAQVVSITNVRNGRVSRDVTGLDAGTHSATIVATSTGGSSTHTWTFTVELDGTPPVISAVAPQGVVKTDSVTLSAAVTDAESDITRVTIALDGGTAQVVSITNVRNGRISRDVTGLDAGTHTGTIVATSAGGSSTHIWTFTVDLDVTPPAITSTAPHGIVRIEKPVVSVSASDDMSGVDSIDITVKDSAGKEIRGSTRESGDGTSASFTPSSALTAGTYSAEAEVEDASGNATSAAWSFTVEFDTVPPSITVVSPQGESHTTELRPVITATYTDNVSGVDESSVKLTLDGNPVTPDKVSVTQVSFAPPNDLSFGRHTVTLEVKDLATPDANTATQEWSFIVEGEIAKMLNLRNFPNPFLNTTTIAFTLSREAKVTIEIYDMTGRLVNSLVQSEVREAGEVKIEWNGKTPEGDDLARGVYFMQVIIQSELGPQALVWKLAKL